jgi:hypothetical protein
LLDGVTDMHDDISRDICRLIASANLGESLERRLSEQLQEAVRVSAGSGATLAHRVAPAVRRPASKIRVG